MGKFKKISKYKPKNLKESIILFFSLILPQSIGILGAVSTQTGNSIWYNELAKPFFNPPSWIFGPVWTILYLIIGIIFYLIYKESKISKKEKRILIKLFIFQMILNGIWTPIFFGFENLFAALFVIISLDVTLIYMFLRFRKLKFYFLSYLWILYILWVSFASILNLSILLLN
jgi:tryptophan-rich sensory protein